MEASRKRKSLSHPRYHCHCRGAPCGYPKTDRRFAKPGRHKTIHLPRPLTIIHIPSRNNSWRLLAWIYCPAPLISYIYLPEVIPNRVCQSVKIESRYHHSDPLTGTCDMSSISSKIMPSKIWHYSNWSLFSKLSDRLWYTNHSAKNRYWCRNFNWREKFISGLYTLENCI